MKNIKLVFIVVIHNTMKTVIYAERMGLTEFIKVMRLCDANPIKLVNYMKLLQ